MTDDLIPEKNGWNEHALLVLHELKRQNSELVALRTSVNDFKVEIKSDISALKVKSGWWGAGSGFLTSIVVLGIGFLFSMKGGA